MELQTEVQLRRRLISRKDRKCLEVGRKEEVQRGADPVFRVVGRRGLRGESSGLGCERFCFLRR